VLLEKVVLTVGAVCILMATTRATQLFSGLRNLGMPKILAATLLLCLRYLSLLSGEADRMIKAYHLRSVKPRGIRMGDMGSFAGQLLLRSISKAEHVYQAMKLRGFDGTYAIAETRRMDAKSACYAAFTGVLILLFRFLPAEKLFGLIH
jgi:cobalt/nickel transport system permease protein